MKGRLILSIFIYLYLANINPIFAFQEIELPQDSQGWTVFEPSPDSRILYVSESGDDDTGLIYTRASTVIGDDPFNPIGTIRPFRTYQGAAQEVREGYPDWILFKRGDTFSAQLLPVGGRNDQEFSLISSYGSTGALPVIHPVTPETVNMQIRVTDGRSVEYAAITGLYFYSPTRDPDNPEFSSVVDGGTPGSEGYRLTVSRGLINKILIEGCKFQYFRNNVMENLGDKSESLLTNITMRRNHILDNYKDDGHSQGTFITEVDGIKFEENIFDHNGWKEQKDGTLGPASWFNHNAYITDCKDVILHRNISLRASSIGWKITIYEMEDIFSQLTIVNNLVVDGEIGFSISGTSEVPYRFNEVFVSDNVMVNLGLSNPTLRGVGWGLDLRAVDRGIITRNYILHNSRLSGTTNSRGFNIIGFNRDVDLSNNTIYDMQGPSLRLEFDSSIDNENQNIVIKGNQFQEPNFNSYLLNIESLNGVLLQTNTYYSPSQSYAFVMDNTTYSYDQWKDSAQDNSIYSQKSLPDSSRTLESYMESLGYTGSLESFYSRLRMMDRYNWDDDLSAAKINDWLKRGFASDSFLLTPQDYTTVPSLWNGTGPIRLGTPSGIRIKM